MYSQFTGYPLTKNTQTSTGLIGHPSDLVTPLTWGTSLSMYNSHSPWLFYPLQSLYTCLQQDIMSNILGHGGHFPLDCLQIFRCSYFTGWLPQMANSRLTPGSGQGGGWTRVQVALDVGASVMSMIQAASLSCPSSPLPHWQVFPLPLGAQVVHPLHGAA
jgi:hypothetical protein